MLPPRRGKKLMSLRTLCFLGMATCASMMLSYAESFIPLGLPGLKPGIANIFTVFILYRIGAPYAAAVSLVRCCLTALLFGNAVSLWYSLAGAALSLTVMLLLQRISVFTSMGVSIAGGVCHNAAQLAVAIAVTGVKEIGWYFPVLCVAGTVAGIIVGAASGLMLKKLEKFRIK